MKKTFVLLFFIFFSMSAFSQVVPKTIADCVKNNYFDIVDIIEDEDNESIQQHKICRAYIFKNEEDFDLYIRYVIELNYLDGLPMKIISDLKALATASNNDCTDTLDYKVLKEHNAEFMVYIKYFTEKDVNYRRLYFVRLYKGKIYTSYNTKKHAF